MANEGISIDLQSRRKRGQSSSFPRVPSGPSSFSLNVQLHPERLVVCRLSGTYLSLAWYGGHFCSVSSFQSGDSFAAPSRSGQKSSGCAGFHPCCRRVQESLEPEAGWSCRDIPESRPGLPFAVQISRCHPVLREGAKLATEPLGIALVPGDRLV